MTTNTSEGTHVYRVYIKATPEAIWTAITDPQWNDKYGYGAPCEYELKPHGKYRVAATDAMKQYGASDVLIDGEVIESDPPRKLVQTWRALWDPEVMAEGFRRVTWEIEPGQGGVTTLTLTHELQDAPRTAAQVSGQIKEAGGGWSFILSDLKTLLETGKSFQGWCAA